eukprot:3504038-Prymnesium_polylepis.1
MRMHMHMHMYMCLRTAVRPFGACFAFGERGSEGDARPAGGARPRDDRRSVPPKYKGGEMSSWGVCVPWLTAGF